MAATKPTNLPGDFPLGLRIGVSERGTTTTIELEGEWDLAQCDATGDALDQALGRRPESLVLDLSRLAFIDSSGIHGLIDTYKRCTEQGTSLEIIPGLHAVQRVFELCGVIGILPFAAPEGPADSETLLASAVEPGG